MDLFHHHCQRQLPAIVRLDPLIWIKAQMGRVSICLDYVPPLCNYTNVKDKPYYAWDYARGKKQHGA